MDGAHALAESCVLSTRGVWEHMNVFIAYDASREHACASFTPDAEPLAESGYLEDGLWVEFASGDPVRLCVVVVEHPFFARSAGFAERLTEILGQTVVGRLHACHRRTETLVGQVDLEIAEYADLLPGWERSRRELRSMQGRFGALTEATREVGGSVREWLVPVRLEPVVARATRLPAVTGGKFDTRAELSSDLADTLQIEPTVRIDIADGVLHLRAHVRAGKTPPEGVMMELVGTDSVVPMAYDASRGELAAGIPVGAAAHPLPNGGIASLVRLRLQPERATDV